MSVVLVVIAAWIVASGMVAAALCRMIHFAKRSNAPALPKEDGGNLLQRDPRR